MGGKKIWIENTSLALGHQGGKQAGRGGIRWPKVTAGKKKRGEREDFEGDTVQRQLGVKTQKLGRLLVKVGSSKGGESRKNGAVEHH